MNTTSSTLSLAEATGHKLLQRGLTIATAESCTAGLVAAALTEPSGSSGYFIGGAITYSNAAKHRVLGVPLPVLEAHGAVSAETAGAMARGGRALYGTDLCVAVTGIAGPGGGTPDKPVGLVYIALADRDTVRTERCLFHGSRSEVRRQTVETALHIILQRLTP